MCVHAHTCPHTFSLFMEYLMETATFPGNSAGKQRYRGDFMMKDRRSLGKQNLRRTTHLYPHSIVSCFIHIRGEPGRSELRFCLLLFFSAQRWLPGSMRRIALPRMIAGRIQAICRPNCRSTRLSKRRSWPIETAWTPSNLWEKWGWWQGGATGMKDSADSLNYSDLKRGGITVPSLISFMLSLRGLGSLFFLCPSRTFCHHWFLSTSFLLSSVSLLSIFTVHAMERDRCFQLKIQSADFRDFFSVVMPL